MKSLDDVDAPQDGLRFWSWGTTNRVVFLFLSEFGEPKHSRMGLLEATVVANGNEYILAPGSKRLLFALKPFAPLRGKSLLVEVVGEGVERQFKVSDVSGPPRPPENEPGGRHMTPGRNKTLAPP